MKLTNETVKILKKDFPIFDDKKLIYLDSAATSQKPNQVIGVIKEFYERENANAYRGVYTLSEKATQKYDEARKIVANFINSDFEEIIFTKNTTESLNFLSYTLDSVIPLGRDEIVLTEMEHHSNLVPWQQLAKRNKMKLKFVKLKNDFTLDFDDAKKKITDKTAILSIVHVSNVLGTINPIKDLVKLGKQMGSITIIDVAQSISRIKVDVEEIGCDFLAFSGHKMMGPMGIGVLYGRKKFLEKLRPFNFGGGMIKEVFFEDAKWKEIPYKFEAGTPNIVGAIALGESIKYIQNIGIENIYRREKELLKYAFKKIKNINGIKIYNPGLGKSLGILSFNIGNIHPHDVASIMNDYGIAIRAGHNCAMPLMNVLGLRNGASRASFYFYNTFEDIDRFVRALVEVKNKFN